MDAIHPSRSLIDSPPPYASFAVRCPQCGDAPGSLPPVVSALLSRALVRCARCGTRRTLEPAADVVVHDCASCELPFLAAAGDAAICATCAAGSSPLGGAADPGVLAATMAELRPALDEAWEFVAATHAAPYLNRLLRQTARAVELPVDCRALAFREPALRSLFLPPDIVLLSTGTLDSIHDEAELVFVLAHELAHATHDPTGRLMRLGLRALTRHAAGPGPETWVQLAHDVIRLGYGERRELEADRRAFGAVLAAGYDPLAPSRYLERLDRRATRGDPAVAELSLAHPPAGQRVRALERSLPAGFEAAPVPRLNREPFRRAVGELADGSLLARVHPLASPAADLHTVPPRRRLGWVAAALLAAAAAASALWLLL